MNPGFISQKLIKFGEARNGKDEPTIDTIQFLITYFITNNYFPWLALTLVLNTKNWKRLVIVMATILWFLKSLGNVFDKLKKFYKKENDLTWPNSYERWRYCIVPYYVVWLIAEIFADWYPLIRTKSVTNNGWKKIYYVYVSCILYNLSKLYGIFTYLQYYNVNLSPFDENGNPRVNLMEQKVYWWRCVAVIQITSLIYDICVIYSLKTCLFDKLKEFRGKNNLLDKFKYISELRIVLSMIASIAFFPFAVIVAVSIEKVILGERGNQHESPENRVEELRNVVITINYTFMYIDQILLKIYASNYKNDSSCSDDEEDEESTYTLDHIESSHDQDGGDTNENGNNKSKNKSKIKSKNKSKNKSEDEDEDNIVEDEAVGTSKASNMSNTSYFKKLNFIQNALVDYEKDHKKKSMITLSSYSPQYHQQRQLPKDQYQQLQPYQELQQYQQQQEYQQIQQPQQVQLPQQSQQLHHHHQIYRISVSPPPEQQHHPEETLFNNYYTNPDTQPMVSRLQDSDLFSPDIVKQIPKIF